MARVVLDVPDLDVTNTRWAVGQTGAFCGAPFTVTGVGPEVPPARKPPAEHYELAEQNMVLAKNEVDAEGQAVILAAAQVQATLALAGWLGQCVEHVTLPPWIVTTGDGGAKP